MDDILLLDPVTAVPSLWDSVDQADKRLLVAIFLCNSHGRWVSLHDVFEFMLATDFRQGLFGKLQTLPSYANSLLTRRFICVHPSSSSLFITSQGADYIYRSNRLSTSTQRWIRYVTRNRRPDTNAEWHNNRMQNRRRYSDGRVWQNMLVPKDEVVENECSQDRRRFVRHNISMYCHVHSRNRIPDSSHAHSLVPPHGGELVQTGFYKGGASLASGGPRLIWKFKITKD